MSDIFDEKEDLKNIKSFVSFLRNEYEVDLHERERYKVSVKDGLVEDRAYIDPDEVRRRNHLVTHWPGDDVVSQIVKDTCRIMVNNNLKPDDLL